MNPEDLARRVERCLAAAAAAEWPGRDPEACAFAEWLAGCWVPACPVVPAGPPAAASRVGRDPAGLRWFATDGATVGCAADHPAGCYVVPAGHRPPGEDG